MIKTAVQYGSLFTYFYLIRNNNGTVVFMRKIKHGLALFLALTLMIALGGCGIGGNAKYRIVNNLERQQFCVAFRKDDKSGEFVIAKLKELQASGEIRKLSVKWFGDDYSILKGDIEAFDKLEELPEARSYNVGYDAGRLPFSGNEKSGEPTGFDVELAKLVCSELGWKVKFIPVDVSQAEVELNSGNVDCIWGGFAYNESSTKINQSPVYMENTVIVASLAGSKVRSLGSLKGKTLTVGENKYYSALIEANQALREKPEFINIIPGGAGECFKALENGECDAIITDKAALDYYLNR